MTTKVKHPDRLAEQINNILADPKSCRLAAYHTACGTKHSIAGHGQIASGMPMHNDTCKADARKWYGLTGEDAGWLFRGERTLPELHGFASAALAGKAYFGADGFNRDGFNRKGFDRGGFNRDGFNRAGYDRAGYDRKGYSRYGFNRDGYNRKGYDRNGCYRDGFNRAGYDRDGFDRNGFDRDGFNRDGYARYGLDRNGDILPILNIATGDTQ